MFTLKEICYENIARDVVSAPPLIQEIIMGETYTRVKSNMKDDVVKEVKKDVKTDMCKTLPFLVPDIMKDIIASMTIDGYTRRDFRDEYKHLCPEIVQCAIITAESAVNIMESHYVHRAFEMVNYSSGSDEDDY